MSASRETVGSWQLAKPGAIHKDMEKKCSFQVSSGQSVSGKIEKKSILKIINLCMHHADDECVV